MRTYLIILTTSLLVSACGADSGGVDPLAPADNAGCSGGKCDSAQPPGAGLYVSGPELQTVRHIVFTNSSTPGSLDFMLPAPVDASEPVPIFGTVKPVNGAASYDDADCSIDFRWTEHAVTVSQRSACIHGFGVFDGEYQTIAGTYEHDDDERRGTLTIHETSPARINVQLEMVLKGGTNHNGVLIAADVPADSGLAVVEDVDEAGQSCQVFMWFLSDFVEVTQKGERCPSAGAYVTYDGRFARQ